MRKNLLIFLSLLLFSTSALAVERVIKLYSERRAGGEYQPQERTLCGESGERREYNDKESVSEIINPLFNL